ncbi:MAG: hypothetical protein V7739_08950 [Motiliproteus sp.]
MTELPIKINPRYKSSTRIDSDSSDYKQFIDDYIVHGTTISTLETLSREYSGSAQRAYTLTGPYGSGKSTIALYLSYLLSENPKERKYAQNKLTKDHNSLNDFSRRFQVKKGWIVIKHVCGLESPAHAILASIYKNLGKRIDSKKLNLLTDDECLKKIMLVISAPSEQYDGIVLLLDEMGKALDYLSKENKDLHLFQSLADIVQQSESPVILIGFLHQAFTDYARNKDASAQKEWGKIQGRYRDLSYNPSIDESLILVGESIKIDSKLSNQIINRHKELVGQALKSFPQKNRNSAALENTLPLDPIVSLLLGPISRRRFSQNERSIFGFLASQEPLGFRDFLLTNYTNSKPSLELYQPEQLWDYLHHNLHHLITTSHDSKAWLEGCDAIHRAEQKGKEIHVSITKVIALLTIFGFHHHLHAKEEFIIDYFKARGATDDIKQSIDDLKQWSIIIYRQNYDALFVFQGSDIDINSRVVERIESISHGVNWTEICENSQNILATAHYHKTGTMRWANIQLVKKIDPSQLEQAKNPPLTGDKFLSFILSTTPIDNNIRKLSEKTPHIAISSPKSLESLKSAAIELIALQQILKGDEKIQHDLIAKREINNRIVLATKNLDNALIGAFKTADWHHQGKALKARPLSVHASQIADEIYCSSPIVQNELVNRSKPSGSANTAIRKLMFAMLKNGETKDLGFDENLFPPEKAIYLSCIKSKGWHQKTTEGYLFPSKWSKKNRDGNPDIYELMRDGIDFIKSSNEIVTLAQLYTRWMAPPFGLTAGLCRVYGMALLKAMDGQVAFYDQDSTKQFLFIPELDEVLVEKVYKHPAEAGVRYFHISDIQTHLLDTLAKATIGDTKTNDSILGIAKHIVKIVHTLPAWVKKTSGDSFSGGANTKNLSTQARTFRNKVIKANDPYNLILEELPLIFNLNINDKGIDKKLSKSLKSVLSELEGQHGLLLSAFEKIITNNLSANLDQDLKTRCKKVSRNKQRPNISELAKRIIDVIDQKDGIEKVINLAIGASEKNWTDVNIRNGLDELENLCTQFRRIESFERISEGNESASKPLALISTDKKGNYIGYESFIMSDLENDKEVKSTIKLIESNVKAVSKEKKVAALSHLLSSLMDREEA